MSPKNFDFTGLYTIVLTESHRDQYTIITRGTLFIYLNTEPLLRFNFHVCSFERLLESLHYECDYFGHRRN